MKKTAIISVAYNRPDCLQRQLASLEQAFFPEPATLIVSIDKSNTDAVERLAEAYHWPHGELRVARHEHNLGLRAHMLSLGRYFDEFDALIVLEDDVTVSPSFYAYAQACVAKYYADDRIAGISLYSFAANYQTYLPFMPAKSGYDVYLMNCAQSWGEVWMKPQWLAFMQWYETHAGAFSLEHLPACLNQWPESSWLKYHTRYCIEADKYFIYPYFSLSTNNADPGVNHKGAADTFFQADLLATLQLEFRLPDVDEAEIRYDGFLQPRFLGKHLGIAEEDLCVDLFAAKPACLFRRYVLSDRQLPFKAVRAFALQLRPVELNILCGREGSELWLYDTTQPARPPQAPDPYLAYAYFYQKGFYKARTMIGLRRSLALLWELVRSRLPLRGALLAGLLLTLTSLLHAQSHTTIVHRRNGPPMAFLTSDIDSICFDEAGNVANDLFSQTSGKVTSVASLIAPGDSLALPLNNIRRNTQICATCRFDTLRRVTFGRGPGAFAGSWVDVSPDSVGLHEMLPTERLTGQFPHGLSITDGLTILIDYGEEGTATLTLLSGRQTFTTAISWWAGGETFLINGGPAPVYASLSFTAKDTFRPVWFFADSYFNWRVQDRWPYYLWRDGYTKWLADHKPGEASREAARCFDYDITLGRPQYAVWCLGMNDAADTDAADNVWLEAVEHFVGTCRSRGITPILSTIPNVPARSHIRKNEWVRRSGLQYIDFAAAVGADASSAWTPGMLSPDSIHPTPSGARAMAEQVLKDFPQLRQLCK